MSALLETIREKKPYYIALSRIDRPIGILLLMWPTLIALWVAGEGNPSLKNIIIFVAGVVLMRSAGCVINDYADRNLDGFVERTKERPLATGLVTAKEAIGLFLAIAFCAFLLVLFLNPFTIYLSFGGLALAVTYPFMKRYTYLPQVVLGAAFAWAIPMAFAAQTGELPHHAWLIYAFTVLWTVAYDTEYAMVDRNDDLKVGIKSTAILFGDADKFMIGVLQVMALSPLVFLGRQLEFSFWWYLGLAGALALFGVQQKMITERKRPDCFAAFLHNNWVGATIFAGLYLHYSTN